MMSKIKDYWTTVDGEPELRDFANYILDLISTKLGKQRKQDNLKLERIIGPDEDYRGNGSPVNDDHRRIRKEWLEYRRESNDGA